MTAIKICGITRLEDASFIARCGADALGFIFYPPSPRYVTPEQAKIIISGLPVREGSAELRPHSSKSIFPVSRRIATVGVFVNETVDKVMDIASYCGLDIIQLHGDESADYCRHFPAERIIKAFALKTPADVEHIKDYEVRAILVDTHDPVHYGGTGRTSNWELAAQAKILAPLILSGGLHPGNIREALEAVAPAAVDINSGVEDSPGIKDHEKVRTIIQMIRTRI
jgi:phosphoribosylanthranilate isomerase